MILYCERSPFSSELTRNFAGSGTPPPLRLQGDAAKHLVLRHELATHRKQKNKNKKSLFITPLELSARKKSRSLDVVT